MKKARRAVALCGKIHGTRTTAGRPYGIVTKYLANKQGEP